MGRFNKEERFGGRNNMHQATCAACGKMCEVPFKPNGIKPVYCSDCFKKERGEDHRGSEREFSRPNRDEKRMFTAVCAECGDECEVPFRPTPGKTVLCSECFNKAGNKTPRASSAPSIDQKQQFDLLNVKLDKILRVLNLSFPEAVKNSTPVKTEENKPAEVKKEAVKPPVKEIKSADTKKAGEKNAKKKIEKKAEKKKVAKKK